jgi:hypothetical protein
LIRERAQQLALKVGELVYVRPQSVRVFMPDIDYAI